LLGNEEQGRRRANTTIGKNVLPRLQRVRNRYKLSESATFELPFIKQLQRLPMLARHGL